MAHNPVGLSKVDLEYELKWAMRKAPKDPSKLVDFLGQALVDIIHKNNQAVAKALTERERTDLPQEA